MVGMAWSEDSVCNFNSIFVNLLCEDFEAMPDSQIYSQMPHNHNATPKNSGAGGVLKRTSFASAGGCDSNPRPSDLQADAMTIRPRRLPSVSPKRVSMSRTGRQNFAWLSGVGSQTWRQNLVWPPPFVVLSTFEEDFEAILDHPLFHFEGASRFKIEVGQVFQIPQERDTFSQLNI